MLKIVSKIICCLQQLNLVQPLNLILITRTPPSGSPNFIMSDSRRRTPPKGILKKKDRNTEVTEAPAAAASKNLITGQVKILKRGEVLRETSTVPKEVDDRKVCDGEASTPPEAFEIPLRGRRGLAWKKKAEKDRTMLLNLSPKVEVSKGEEFALSSMDRLGPDPEMVSKQMKKNITEFFAGSVFSDSPPPSSVPLPGFCRKNFAAAVAHDATTDLRRILGLSLCRY